MRFRPDSARFGPGDHDPEANSAIAVRATLRGRTGEAALAVSPESGTARGGSPTHDVHRLTVASGSGRGLPHVRNRGNADRCSKHERKLIRWEPKRW
jgi:hypothetical protein